MVKWPFFVNCSIMYFTQDFSQFFKDLAAHNNREWFAANKKRYIKHVKEPFEALVADLIQATGAKVPVKDAVFRIYRDVRFSKDKTPYQLHASAIISDGGRKSMQVPGMYVHLSAQEQHIGGGVYMPEKEELARIRHAIIQNEKAFEDQIQNKKFKSLYSGILGERNKILPKEFRDMKLSESSWVYQKQFYFMADYDDESLPLRKDLLPFILEHHSAGLSMNTFFEKAMRPS